MANDVYIQVNDHILAALEQGIIPWRRPWTGQLPTNYDSGKQYRGVNILTLGIAEMEADWQVEDADMEAVAIPATYRITYRTFVTDLTSKG